MKPDRSPVEIAAGKLISAVQREWHAEAGEASEPMSEEVMGACHDLLKAAKVGSLNKALGGKTVAQFLGEAWVASHPMVLPAIQALEASANGSANV